MIEPDQGFAPLLALVTASRSSIELVIYELQDRSVSQALAAAAARGVRVRVLLNSAPGGGMVSSKNAPEAEYLSAHGVSTHPSPAAFTLTHQKTLIVDGNVAAIMTANFTPAFYSTTRDFVVLDRQPSDVAAIIQTFDADFASRRTTPSQGTGDLVWSPGARSTLVQMIAGAHRSIEIYNESVGERGIERAICDAARRGVAVHILMTDQPRSRRALSRAAHCGAVSRTFAPNASLYIHAKVIVADDRTAFVGSQNFTYPAVANNRELGIVLDNPTVVRQLTTRFAGDWVR